jgi:hypothetical protein
MRQLKPNDSQLAQFLGLNTTGSTITEESLNSYWEDYDQDSCIAYVKKAILDQKLYAEQNVSPTLQLS